MDEEVARDLERLEARLWTDAVRAATPEIAARYGLDTVPIGGGVALIATKAPTLLYNRAIAFGLDDPIDEATLDRAIGLYRRDVPFSIQPSPLARPAEIGDWLRARGMESWFDWVIWARDARRPFERADGPRIERIGEERATLWTELAATIFREESELGPWIRCVIGRPRWSHYVAYDGAQPIGIGASYVEGELGWLGWGGTLPEWRRRGVQAAMIARRVRDAAELGVRWVRSETAADLPDKPNSSYRNMARAGFAITYRRPSHAVFPPA